MEHYRCQKAWITDERQVRIVDTIFFKHKYLTMPTLTPAKVVIKAAGKLEEAIAGILPKHTDVRSIAKIIRTIHKHSKQD